MAACLSAFAFSSFAQTQKESLEQTISHSEVFPEPLAWVEPTAPSLQEDQSLQAALALAALGPLPDSLSTLEDFITNYPQSPWVPALRAGLARAYHETGRDTLALEHWQAAWNATSRFDAGKGKHVADYTLAHWTRLLASLGRIETLDAIMLETQGRVLDRGPLSQMWCRTRESWVDMHLRPGVSYRCGTLALHYKAWCEAGNNRPPGDRGKGWTKNSPCEECYQECMKTGCWPFNKCGIPGNGDPKKRGPAWPPGGKWPGGRDPVWPGPNWPN